MTRRGIPPRSFAVGAALALAASGAPAQMPKAPPAAVAAAVLLCAEATTPSGTDAGVFERAGWSRATASSNGKAVDVPVSFYGKGAANPVVLIGREGPAAKGCAITSSLPAPDGFAAVGDAITAALGAQPRRSGPTERIWFARGDLVVLNLTGTRDAPAVRVGTTHIPEEKK